MHLEFEEGELSDLQSIADRLFLNSNDPTSPNYRRILLRPNISWVRICMAWLIPLVASIAVVVLMAHFHIRDGWIICALITGWIIYGLIRFKAAVLCIIQIYQRFAPDSVRCKCRFEPSCSVYVTQAVEKYGVIRGLRKGIGRLLRCKPGYGGFEPLD